MSLFTQSAPWVTTEHRIYADMTRRFLQDNMVPHVERWYDQGHIDREFWNLAGEAGIMGAGVPEEYGGIGAGMSFEAVTLYEQGFAGDVSWGYAIQSIVMHYLVAYASEENKHKWLPKLVSGQYVGAIAMTEPGAGSDLQAIRTTAKLEGDEYVINGSKTFITNGQQADLIIVVCKTDPTAGAKGTSLIVVETDQVEGFERGRNLKKMGMKGNDTSELFFNDVRVPATNILGDVAGQGFFQLMNQLTWERLIVGVCGLGCADFGLQETIRYTQERKAFGKPVFEFQNSRFKLAEAKTKLEVTRSFVSEAIAQADAGTLDATMASMVKYWASEVQNEVLDECVQLHGGYGYMMEYPITRLYADARVQKIYAGTNEIMKELIARSL